jgi:hypothetical protein
LAHWFASRALSAGIGTEGDHRIGRLRPNRTIALYEPLEPDGTKAACVTGMYDFSAHFSDGDTAPPQLQVTLCAAKSELGTPVRPEALPWAQMEAGEARSRDLYAHDIRSVEFKAAADRVWWLNLAGDVDGPYAYPLPNEYEPSQTHAGQINKGNYGVLYDLRFQLSNPSAQTVRVKALLSADGGSGASVVVAEDQIKSCPQMSLKAHHAWVVEEITLPPGATKPVHIYFSLPGGTPGAQRLYLWPESE